MDIYRTPTPDRARQQWDGPGEPQGPILVVDDDPSIREMVRLLLEADGFAVETAADGREALEWAAQKRPALVVLDLGLPVRDGHEVAARLRSRYGRALPIVVVTAERRAAEKARDMRAAALLVKPFEIEELSQAVQRALRPDR